MSAGNEHADMQRDLGRVEGKQDAMGLRLDNIEKAVLRVGEELKRELHAIKVEAIERADKLNDRLARIEKTESERRGAWRALVAACSALAALVSGGVVWLIKHFIG